LARRTLARRTLARRTSAKRTLARRTLARRTSARRTLARRTSARRTLARRLHLDLYIFEYKNFNCVTLGHFHQHFTCSFYECRFQKRKKILMS
jgi:hypothetical protein